MTDSAAAIPEHLTDQAVLIAELYARRELLGNEFDALNQRRQLLRTEIGNALRQLREAADISLREMARRITLSPMYLSDVERANRAIPATLIEQYLTHCAGVPQAEVEQALQALLAAPAALPTPLVDRPCPKCGTAPVSCETVDSSCGGYTDEKYTCPNCRHIWWIDGPDA
jgi:hypothetical protein